MLDTPLSAAFFSPPQQLQGRFVVRRSVLQSTFKKTCQPVATKQTGTKNVMKPTEVRECSFTTYQPLAAFRQLDAQSPRRFASQVDSC